MVGTMAYESKKAIELYGKMGTLEFASIAPRTGNSVTLLVLFQYSFVSDRKLIITF